MRAAAWLVSLFAAAALGARKMAPQGMSLLSRAPVHRRAGRSGSRAKVTAATIKRRSRKLTAIAREKRRQRRAQR